MGDRHENTMAEWKPEPAPKISPHSEWKPGFDRVGEEMKPNWGWMKKQFVAHEHRKDHGEAMKNINKNLWAISEETQIEEEMRVDEENGSVLTCSLQETERLHKEGLLSMACGSILFHFLRLFTHPPAPTTNKAAAYCTYVRNVLVGWSSLSSRTRPQRSRPCAPGLGVDGPPASTAKSRRIRARRTTPTCTRTATSATS